MAGLMHACSRGLKQTAESSRLQNQALERISAHDVFIRSFADAPVPSTPSTSAPASSGESKGASFFRIPKFLRRFVPGSSAVDVAPATGEATSSSGSDAAKTEEQAKQEKELMERLARGTIDDYKWYLAQVLSSRTTNAAIKGPAPKQPPVPMWHKDYKQWVDFRRVEYMRMYQQHDICQNMSEAQKERINTERGGVLRDVAFLREVADSAIFPRGNTKYCEWEVADTIWAMFNAARETRLMAREKARQPENWQPPDSEEGKQKLLERLQEEEAREWYKDALRKRDPQACTLPTSPSVLLGDGPTCGSTGLPWAYCCGNKPLHINKLVEMVVQTEGIGALSDPPGRLVNKLLADPLARQGPIIDASDLDVSTGPQLPPIRFDIGEQTDPERPNQMRVKPSKWHRPAKLNHLLPLPEGSQRQKSHERPMRDMMRTQLRPKFKRTA